jgi:hypothetical protein
MSRVCLNWASEGLIVANIGMPFTVGGLEALCSSHRSDKTEGKPKAFACTAEAEKRVLELRMNRLEAYKRCPGDIVDHARAEKEMGLDYTNRLLLELLQNADDAAADDPIGYKGLGFKAVLDIADQVRIRSGHLQVRFDREESRKALLKAGLPAQGEVPVLRLPFWDDQEVAIPEVEDSYDTIVTLLWRSADDRIELFAKEWEAVSGDPTILLFLHALEEVVWQPLEGDAILWQCDRHAEPLHLSMRYGADEPQSSRWRILRDPSGQTTNAAGVPVDPDGRPLPYRHDRVRVFFPTEENSPLPMVLHGEFDLEQNRKRVRPGGTRADTAQALSRCVKSALGLVQDDGTFLDLLLPRDGMAALDQEIWEAIKVTVRDMPLPQSRAKIGEIRLCPPSYSICWQRFKELLERYRLGGLAGLQFLPPGVDSENRENRENREKVVLAFNPDARLNIESLRALPLFPVEGSNEAVAAAGHHLFFPPADNQSQPAPEGIRIGFLREGFAKGCKEDPAVQRLLRDLGLCEFTPQAIANALAEQRIEEVGQQALWDYMLAVVVPLLKDSDRVMDWNDKARGTLAECIQVPCRDGHWRPAVKVYAGREWTNDDFLERAYGARQDRAFFAPPPPEETVREASEQLARWLGVGWSPKVLPVVNCHGKSGTREGIRWTTNVFPLSSAPARWREHCAELNKDGVNFHRKARLRQDWTLDGNEEVLRLDGAFACTVREWRSYKDYLQAVIYRSSNMREDYDNENVWGAPSYLSHLFKHVSWISAEGADSPVAACDVFAKGSEVHQALPGWVFGPTVEVTDEAAPGLGIRASWRELSEGDWKRWLTRAVQSDATLDIEVRKRIRKLYEETLARSSPDGALHLQWDGLVWCVEKHLDNTEEWRLENSRQTVLYVDRPDLARLRLKGISTFPVELGWSGNKRKVSDIFGAAPLSQHLRGRAEFTNSASDDNLAERIRGRLQDRIDCLVAYLRVNGKDSSAARQKWDELAFRVGPDLRVEFLLDDRLLETEPRPAFFQPKSERDPSILWLDTSANFTDQPQPRGIVWEEVGSALCYTAGLALEDGAVLDALLGCGEDSLKRKLLNLGVTEADIESALLKTATSEPILTQLVPPQPQSAIPLPPAPASPGGGHPPPSGQGGGGGHGGGGGGGESLAHRELKDKLWERPELIEAGMQKYRYEPELESHYRPDLILKDAQGKFVAVEVEVEFPGESDYGVWQAVAYKHVVAAEFKEQCEQVRGVLVAPQIPESLKQKCKQLGVESIELSREIFSRLEQL